MATEMPIPQDYDRYIDPMQDETKQNLEGDESLFEIFDQEESEVEELPDGSAIVRMDDLKGPEENPDFYANMAEELDSWELSKIALKYLDLIDSASVTT